MNSSSSLLKLFGSTISDGEGEGLIHPQSAPADSRPAASQLNGQRSPCRGATLTTSGPPTGRHTEPTSSLLRKEECWWQLLSCRDPQEDSLTVTAAVRTPIFRTYSCQNAYNKSLCNVGVFSSGSFTPSSPLSSSLPLCLSLLSQQSGSVPLIILLFLCSLRLTLTDKYSSLSHLNLIFAARDSRQSESWSSFGTGAVYICATFGVLDLNRNNSQTSCLINGCVTASRGSPPPLAKCGGVLAQQRPGTRRAGGRISSGQRNTDRVAMKHVYILLNHRLWRVTNTSNRLRVSESRGLFPAVD